MEIPSKKQIIIRITATIALIELAIMILFASVNLEAGLYTEAFLGVFLLVLFSTPVIYLWIISPYVAASNDAISTINHLAHHDPLTNLPNRRLLSLFLEKLLPSNVRHKSHGAILFIDLDQFKTINDTEGHEAGDGVLVETAVRLVSLVRADDIASRVGGDEFVIVLGALGRDEQTARENALLVSRRIQKDLQKPIHFKNTVLQINCSIGVHLLKPVETNADAVLNEADTAMYNAKKSGLASAHSDDNVSSE